MKTFFISLAAVIIIHFFTINVYAQKKVYTGQCKLIKDLVDSADKSFFNFQSRAYHSSITILDVNKLLNGCLPDSIGQVKLLIIDSGAEIDKIKKDGIFSIHTKRSDLFIFTKEHLNNITGFRMYNPASSGDCYWGFIQKKNLYYLNKKNYGWF
jgi:hypothetical protein